MVAALEVSSYAQIVGATLMIVPPSRIVCAGCAQAEGGQGTGRIQSRQCDGTTPDPVRREPRLPHLVVMMSCDGIKEQETCCTYVCTYLLAPPVYFLGLY